MSDLIAASERVVLSRERLRQAMHEQSSPPNTPQNSDEETSTPAWLDALKSIPGASVLLQTFNAWWAVHPMRVASISAARALDVVVQPLAQRHPIGLVAGAAVLGMLFIRSHPGRWLLKPALLGSLLPQIMATTATHVPPQSWLKMLTSLIPPAKRKRPVKQEDSGIKRQAPSP